MSRRRVGPAAALLLGIVGFYRSAISPRKPAPTCRFEPTCSRYAQEAIGSHGALRGTWLSYVRILKCAPWHPGGWDPVPDRHRGPGGVRGTNSAPVSSESSRRANDAPEESQYQC